MSDEDHGSSRVRVAADEAILLVVDMQERLMTAMPEEARERTIKNIGILLSLAGRMGIHAIATEQYPKGLGRTIPEIAESMPDFEPVEKISFSCCGGEGISDWLPDADPGKIMVTGCETHVCVFQSVSDLLEQGWNVHVPADAVCSRTKENWETGLRLMEKAGAVITSTETVIFDVLRVAGTEEFKFMSRLLK